MMAQLRAPSLEQALREYLPPDFGGGWGTDGFQAEPLPSSRPVFRLSFSGALRSAVGKFFTGCPPATSQDRSLAREYQNYLWLADQGREPLNGSLPRLLGQLPEQGLGVLLEAVSGPDLDHFLAQAALGGQMEALCRRLDKLAGLLTRFHQTSAPGTLTSPDPARRYFNKLCFQLTNLGLFSADEQGALMEARDAWEPQLVKFPDRTVLVHGDATPTNFLFPDGRAVAVDLERLRYTDRLWDVSWVAGELKHAWGWRTGDLAGAEPAIRHFFRAYLDHLRAAPYVVDRVYRLNPFYMALAELRIARNEYLPWDYRRELVGEAMRCLGGGPGD